MMRPRLHFGGNLFQGACAIEGDAEQVLLGPVVWGRIEIKPPVPFVDLTPFDDVEFPMGETPNLIALPGLDISMLPAILVAQHDECLTVADPDQSQVLTSAIDDPAVT